MSDYNTAQQAGNWFDPLRVGAGSFSGLCAGLVLARRLQNNDWVEIFLSYNK
jgi:hypothetical protein